MLKQIVSLNPLDNLGHTSKEAQEFIALTLAEDPAQRLTAGELLRHGFVQRYAYGEPGNDHEYSSPLPMP